MTAAAGQTLNAVARALRSPRRQTALVVLGALLLTALALVSLRDGHYWGGDFSQYIAHARNIATGAPYEKVDYLLMPEYGQARVAPRIYPPMTAVILAPVVAWLGIDLAAMKAVLYPFLAATIVLVFLYYRRTSGSAVALLVALPFALNPQLWWFKDRIESEFPFLFFLYLTFYLVALREAASPARVRFMFIFLAGLAAGFAFATRTTGFIIPAAFVFYEALKQKPSWGETSAFLGVFGLSVAAQLLLVGSLADYSGVALPDDLALNFFNIVINLAYYVAILRELFPAIPPSNILSVLTAFCLAVLLARGLWIKVLCPARSAFIAGGVRHIRALTASVRIVDVFAVLYLAIIIVYPHRQGARFLMPVFPVLIYYAVAGLVSILERVAPFRPMLTAGSLILVIHGVYYAAVGPAIIPHGIHTPESAQMFRVVRGRLPENAFVVFRKPRVMALFGQRRSSIWPFNWPFEPTRAAAWRYFDRIGATHFVVANEGAGLPYPKSMRFDLGPPSPHLTRIFVNAHFVIYRIDSYPAITKASGDATRR